MKRNFRKRKTVEAMVMDIERSSSSSSSSGKKRKQDGGGGGAKCVHPIAKGDHSTGILRSLRDVPPAHYTFKIEYFSSFLNSKIENLESGVFEAGGYKWKLSLYPNGNKKRNANGHISLYLAIAETKTLPVGWEVNVNFKLFVYDHIRDKYLTVQDAEGGIRRFHRMKTEWGFDELVLLNTLNDASNGYLFEDCCVFGAEIFVIKHSGKGECISMIKDPLKGTYTWKIDKFSEIVYENVLSEEFVVGGHKWKLCLYPKGNGTSEGKDLSVFLQLADSKNLPSERKLYAEYKLRVKNQINMKHFERGVATYWFSASVQTVGYPNFMSLNDLNNAGKGFKVNDAVIIEAQIMLLSGFKDF
ncbi:Ubiquitin carboxyl-terminal hydrolase 13 [Camellia lanceoleosa]|uniref:Ubiquitin carboxyl-terminal hydrolase 13 n=1 Tax=Camellia lanceoleosa TaxID=1840588 RepID=A0ACC0IGH4_9ERIC|nr:Ubiquitin carboxyl-terminal hydrolase 13 [Camellia lanceoleosa]